MEEELEEWPPPEARVRSALWRAEGHLERREYYAAFSALTDALQAAGTAERRLLLGLRHLSAAGYRVQDGDRARARRQLAHARRRLTPFPDTEALVDLVAAEIES
ncbi:MAG TPA: hypothetical protein VFO56_08115 [Gaiellaceae bacterium]|nr:hypothetical protein [Gaiellaceae bacterium]